MTDPFKLDGPSCISFSGGRTSAYLLWRVLQANGGLPAGAKVIFCNTGKEEEATLAFVHECSQQWGVPITWLEYRGAYEYRDDGGPRGARFVDGRGRRSLIPSSDGSPSFALTSFASASRAGEPFEAVILQRGGILPNIRSRYCSSELKTRTMHRYLRAQGWEEWETLIGIRADEPRRAAKFRFNPHPETKDEYVRVPLVDAFVGAQDVAAFWRAQPFDLGLPNMNGKTMHGNCDLCMLKPPAQVLALIKEKPSRAIWWIAQEKKAEQFAKTKYGARFADDRPGYAEMLAFARDQRDMFDKEQEAIACFCGD